MYLVVIVGQNVGVVTVSVLPDVVPGICNNFPMKRHFPMAYENIDVKFILSLLPKYRN